jgi:hypothetical protein
MNFSEVELSAIDFKDETFRISEDLILPRMVQSLRAVGLIHPVVLIESEGSSTCSIISGFRRCYGLKSIGAEKAAARILKHGESTTLELFVQAVWDNIAHRQLSPLEAARVLNTLKNVCGVENDVLVEHFLPILGLAPHKNVLQSYLQLHRLHPDLRRLLGLGHLTLASAERLARAAPEIQSAMVPLWGKIRLSASLQREVLDLSEDLAAVSETNLAEVLSQPEVQKVAEDPCLSPFQRGERIHRFLYGWRNPRISRVRERFQAEKAALDLPGTIRMSADPFFESPRLRVEFDVASARDFREAVEALGRASRKPALDRLFEVS